MKIELSQLPENQLFTLQESQEPQGLNLELEGIKITLPIEVNAELIKIQDALDINVNLTAQARAQCARCLNELTLKINKKFRLDYAITKQDTSIDITDDIRQEIILDYPLKPLCISSCKGLCINCGKNLNEGPCNCVNERK